MNTLRHPAVATSIGALTVLAVVQVAVRPLPPALWIAWAALAGLSIAAALRARSAR